MLAFLKAFDEQGGQTKNVVGVVIIHF